MLWKRLRRRWMQVQYKHALNRLLVREYIETFPGCGVAYCHPLLGWSSLVKMVDRVEKLRNDCMVFGCGIPPECEEVWRTIRYVRKLRHFLNSMDSGGERWQNVI